MKFLNKTNIVILLILLSFMVSYRLNQDSNQSLPPDSNNPSNPVNTKAATFSKEPGPDVVGPQTLFQVNHLLNRGYSYLVDQVGLLEKPASCLAKYNIFNYQIDMHKVLEQHVISNDVLIEVKTKEDKGQKVLKEYTVEEIMEAQDFVIKGNYKLPNSNYLYQRGRSIKGLHNKKTILYYHDKQEFTIEINSKSDFPKLNEAFLADALLIFDKPEVKDFDNQEEYLREALAFLYKYGTHYLKKTRWGSRATTITELKLQKEDLKSSKNTPKTDTNIKSGSIGLESNKDKKGDRFTDFDVTMELGNCIIDIQNNEFKNCEKKISDFGLIGYEVDHLYHLFNSAHITGKLTLPDKSVVSPDKIQNIHNNLKNIIEAVENSLYVRNSIIKEFVVYNNLPSEYKPHIGCLENPKTKRFHQFKNSLFSDEHKVGKLHPIFKLNAKDFINYYDLTVVNKKKYGSYACAFKDFNLVTEDIFSSHLFNRKFIKGIKFGNKQIFSEDKTIRPEDCTNLWAGKGVDKIEQDIVAVEYLCLVRTSNFFDPELIVDVKLKSFDKNKCGSFQFNNREYTCLCDKDLVGITNKNHKTQRFLCYATKKSTK